MNQTFSLPVHIRDFFKSKIGPGQEFATAAAMAAYLGIEKTKATKLFNFLKGSDTQYSAVMEWFEKLGGGLQTHNRDTGRDVCFGDAGLPPAGDCVAPPRAGDSIAAPLVDELEAGSILRNGVKSWFLVDRNLPAVRCRRHLIAVEIGEASTSMKPLLNPRDIVLVDRDDRDVTAPGHIMLVLDPGGQGMIRRVSVGPLASGDFAVVYYADNATQHPPLCHSLDKDFLGDWGRAIVGRAIWAWSDVREK